MADASMDIVSKYDKQEVANAVNTAAKEIANTAMTSRGSAPASNSSARSSRCKANSEDRCNAVLDVVQTLADQAGRLPQAPRHATCPRPDRGCQTRNTNSMCR